MIDSPQEKAERAKAIKKLMARWLTTQETKRKADLLLEQHPEIRTFRQSKKRTSS